MSHHKYGSAELLTTPADIAEALHRLAKSIEEDSLSFPQGLVPVSELKGLRIKVSPADSGWLIEVRLKGGASNSSEAVAQADEREEVSFKRLKKRMKRSFKVLRRMLKEGTLPPADLRAAFREDCLRMRELAPLPDPAYAAFEAHGDALVVAEDLDDLRVALGRMGEMECACHQQYR